MNVYIKKKYFKYNISSSFFIKSAINGSFWLQGNVNLFNSSSISFAEGFEKLVTNKFLPCLGTGFNNLLISLWVKSKRGGCIILIDDVREFFCCNFARFLSLRTLCVLLLAFFGTIQNNS